MTPQFGVWWALLLLFLTTPSHSLFESMCVNPGYFNIETGRRDGHRDTGWDRLEHKDPHFDFTKAIWVAAVEYPPPANSFKVNLWFIRHPKSVSVGDRALDGYVGVEVHTNPNPYVLQFVGVWAVNEYNEPYGDFVNVKQYPTAMCGSPIETVADGPQVIPCAAGPSSAPTLPAMYIRIAKSDYTFSTADGRCENTWQTIPPSNQDEYYRAHTIWRAPAQTFCHRPSKFRFIVVATKKFIWEGWWPDWQHPNKPVLPRFITTMYQTEDYGFQLYASDWIHPNYFGLPTRVDLDPRATDKIMCGEPLAGGKHWVDQITASPLDPAWTSKALWTMGGGGPNWSHADVKKRSTCKSNNPMQPDNALPFNGRCEKRVDGMDYERGLYRNQMTCDDGATSGLGQAEFKEEYRTHLTRMQQWIEHSCECLQSVKDQVQNYRALEVKQSDPFGPGNPEDFVPDLSDANEGRSAAAESSEPELVRCQQDMTEEEDHLGGLCLFSEAGTVTFGVRQWHGIASLAQTFLITSMSILLARYTKGNTRLVHGRAPVRGWYLDHTLKLAAPTVWMYLTGMYCLTRQTEVVGRSLMPEAILHRRLGHAAFGLFWFNIVTGFLRPINKWARYFWIHLHWWGGMAQHMMELYLCYNSYLIPGSPSQSFSVLNPSFHRMLIQQLPFFVFLWTCFSIIFHVFISSRQACLDLAKLGHYRWYLPIINPHVTRARDEEKIEERRARRHEIEERIKRMAEELQELDRRKAEGPWHRADEQLAEDERIEKHREEQLLAEELDGLHLDDAEIMKGDEEMDYLIKFLLWVYGFMCLCMFIGSSISLYQNLEDHRYYGLGPMSCTHDSNLQWRKMDADAPSLC